MVGHGLTSPKGFQGREWDHPCDGEQPATYQAPEVAAQQEV